jgi:nickel-dependent lactate racemase
MSQSIVLNTSAWYDDQAIVLTVPDSWDVKIHNPRTIAPLSDNAIREKLETPIAREPLKNLCRGKTSPLIIVDDLNRPTPARKVLPYLLNIFQQENIPLSSVTVLMATGTHGEPPADAMRKKVGDDVVAQCRTLVHDCFRDVRKIGRTSFGTPVYVNQAVLESDLVIGIGGVYPNHTAGFGGGSKIVLGVLGMRSIFHLHHNHQSAGWGGNGTSGTFRQDLDEIAAMVKMQMSISLQVDINREIIQIHCGDPREYFPDAVRFCKEIFSAPRPLDADVVISNAYPNDLSLTFAAMKGFAPLKYCRKDATRIAVAACQEGVGLHNIYPYVNLPRFFRLRHVVRSLSALPASLLIQKVIRRLRMALGLSAGSPAFAAADQPVTAHKNPIWLYRPVQHVAALPGNLPRLKIKSDWAEILDVIDREQGQGKRLRVAVYPCAFLQNIR